MFTLGQQAGNARRRRCRPAQCGVTPSNQPARKAGPWLPPGLDDPRWDFSAKEESDHPGLPYWLASLSYGKHVCQSLIAWCDETIAALQSLETPPPDP